MFFYVNKADNNQFSVFGFVCIDRMLCQKICLKYMTIQWWW